MRNRQEWRPSKYVFHGGRLTASRDPAEVAVSSRLMADLVAAHYDRYLKEHARGRLLDLGCGKVPLLHAYAELVEEVTCVDWGSRPHENDHVDIQCDLTEPLPFADERFDTIILSDVLEHIPRPESLWSEMARVLSKGGKLLMNVPFIYWIHEEPHDYYRYTEFALKRFTDLSGLSLVVIRPMGGAASVLADITSKSLARLPYVGKSIARFVQWGAQVLITTRTGAELSRAKSTPFPCGYFLIAEKL